MGVAGSPARWCLRGRAAARPRPHAKLRAAPGNSCQSSSIERRKTQNPVQSSAVAGSLRKHLAEARCQPLGRPRDLRVHARGGVRPLDLALVHGLSRQPAHGATARVQLQHARRIKRAEADLAASRNAALPPEIPAARRNRSSHVWIRSVATIRTTLGQGTLASRAPRMRIEQRHARSDGAQLAKAPGGNESSYRLRVLFTVVPFHDG